MYKVICQLVFDAIIWKIDSLCVTTFHWCVAWVHSLTGEGSWKCFCDKKKSALVFSSLTLSISPSPARKNDHRFKTLAEESEALIYNYNAVFTQSYTYYTQMYFFYWKPPHGWDQLPPERGLEKGMYLTREAGFSTAHRHPSVSILPEVRSRKYLLPSLPVEFFH